MKKLVSILLVLAMVFCLAACGGTTGEKEGTKKQVVGLTEYNTLYSTELTTFDYVSTTASATNSLAQLTEANLICCDEYGLTRPELTTGWNLADDNVTWTFYIEPGNYWYDYQMNPVEEVTAEDWVTAAKHILNPDEVQGATSTQLKNTIKGATEYWEDNSIGFDKVGVKAIDKYTLQFTLVQPTAYFLTWLSRNTWIGVPTKWFEEHRADFGTTNQSILYCGPYAITEWEPEYLRTLTAIPGFKGYNKINLETLNYRYNVEATSNGAELYLRGETTSVTLSTALYDEWMKDPEKAKLIHPNGYGFIPYFFAFNFDPQYDAKYDPDNWKLAVNNENFRQSLFYGINKFPYIQTMDLIRYEEKTLNTIVYDDFVIVDGKDYIHGNGLEKYSEAKGGQVFDPDKALAYKEKAVEELKAKGCKFPVTVVVPHQTDANSEEIRLLLMIQQLEELFGKDYLKFELIPYAGSAYNTDIRNKGLFSIIERSWGPDYIDPLDSYYLQLKSGNSENCGKLYLAEEYYIPELGYGEFDRLCMEAAAEYKDLNKRYQMFQKAEIYLLDHALTIPIYRQGGGWQANNYHPFTGNCTMYGSQSHLMKYGVMDETSCSTEEYYKIWDAYQEEVAKARAKYPEELKAYEK